MEATARMLDLDSERWAELEHVNGDASDIPELLRRWEEQVGDASAVWETLQEIYNSLVHQTGGYSGAFAAVPHIIRIAQAYGLVDDCSMYPVFAIIAETEIWRVRVNAQVPSDLKEAYFSALERVPDLFCASSQGEWDDEAIRVAFAAICASKGMPELGDCLIDLRESERAQIRELQIIDSYP